MLRRDRRTVRFVFAAGGGAGLAFRFATRLDLATDLRLDEGEDFLATANRRRGLRLVTGAADLVLVTDDARFME